LRKIIHLLSADPEEGLPAEFAETLQPGLFSFKEAKAGILLLGQKLVQGDKVAVGIAKVPVCLAIDCWFKHALGYCRNRRAESNALCVGEMRKAAPLVKAWLKTRSPAVRVLRLIRRKNLPVSLGLFRCDDFATVREKSCARLLAIVEASGA
jgi:hypothetical protein